MTSGHCKSGAEPTESPVLMLLIAGQEAKTPRPIPVLIRNLSTGGVTLAVANPWDIPDWDRRRGEDCVLRVENPVNGESVNIRAKIAWTRYGSAGQPPLSVGLQLLKPPGEAIRWLSNLLSHTSQDIRGLWDRYDQVRKSPGNSDWVHRWYMAGLVLLLGGLVLQFAGPPGYKGWGWVLWLAGSLGIAGKIIRPLWQKQPSSDQIGKTL